MLESNFGNATNFAHFDVPNSSLVVKREELTKYMKGHYSGREPKDREFPLSLTLLIDKTSKVTFDFNLIAVFQGDPQNSVKVNATTISQTGELKITFDQRLLPLKNVFPLDSLDITNFANDSGCEVISKANVIIDGLK